MIAGVRVTEPHPVQAQSPTQQLAAESGMSVRNIRAEIEGAFGEITRRLSAEREP
jgi:hypothetical protein